MVPSGSADRVWPADLQLPIADDDLRPGRPIGKAARLRFQQPCWRLQSALASPGIEGQCEALEAATVENLGRAWACQEWVVFWYVRIGGDFYL